MTAPVTDRATVIDPNAALACATENLSVAYRAEPVLRGVNFRVPKGVVMGIVGPNGAGKSTLIKAMLGLVKPLTGTSTFFGQSLAKERKRVGYMPQSTSVDWDFPTTVLDVVTMGTYGALGWVRRPGKTERARAPRGAGADWHPRSRRPADRGALRWAAEAGVPCPHPRASARAVLHG
ncbi:metal ABC transporter ATP-binding protein [Bowdeniella nasicola]|uniref:metal ABC transporter ATP-binding protein n=1 Tax=Bowdeniella nasicola TaxID=208480 RepID=UPI000A7F557E|nr:ATP-binding cassette domain-containing protein [Bowdeniella nasicola]